MSNTAIICNNMFRVQFKNVQRPVMTCWNSKCDWKPWMQHNAAKDLHRSQGCICSMLSPRPWDITRYQKEETLQNIWIPEHSRTAPKKDVQICLNQWTLQSKNLSFSSTGSSCPSLCPSLCPSPMATSKMEWCLKWIEVCELLWTDVSEAFVLQSELKCVKVFDGFCKVSWCIC